MRRSRNSRSSSTRRTIAFAPELYGAKIGGAKIGPRSTGGSLRRIDARCLRTLRRAAKQTRQRIVRTRYARLLTDRYQRQLYSAILLTPIGGSIARNKVRGTESARNQAVGGDSFMFE